MTDAPAYKNLALPTGGLLELFLMCRERAIRLMASEGMVVHRDEAARNLDAFEMMCAEFLSSTEERWRHWMAKANEEQLNKYFAKERDNFKCVRCGHTRLNRGNLESHHIVPKGAKGDPMYEAMARVHGINSLSNLATLCTDCHHKWGHAGWRRAATWLLAKIGTVL